MPISHRDYDWTQHSPEHVNDPSVQAMMQFIPRKTDQLGRLNKIHTLKGIAQSGLYFILEYENGSQIKLLKDKQLKDLGVRPDLATAMQEVEIDAEMMPSISNPDDTGTNFVPDPRSAGIDAAPPPRETEPVMAMSPEEHDKNGRLALYTRALTQPPDKGEGKPMAKGQELAAVAKRLKLDIGQDEIANLVSLASTPEGRQEIEAMRDALQQEETPPGELKEPKPKGLGAGGVGGGPGSTRKVGKGMPNDGYTHLPGAKVTVGAAGSRSAIARLKQTVIDFVEKYKGAYGGTPYTFRANHEMGKSADIRTFAFRGDLGNDVNKLLDQLKNLDTMDSQEGSKRISTLTTQLHILHTHCRDLVKQEGRNRAFRKAFNVPEPKKDNAETWKAIEGRATPEQFRGTLSKIKRSQSYQQPDVRETVAKLDAALDQFIYDWRYNIESKPEWKELENDWAVVEAALRVVQSAASDLFRSSLGGVDADKVYAQRGRKFFVGKDDDGNERFMPKGDAFIEPKSISSKNSKINYGLDAPYEMTPYWREMAGLTDEQKLEQVEDEIRKIYLRGDQKRLEVPGSGSIPGLSVPQVKGKDAERLESLIQMRGALKGKLGLTYDRWRGGRNPNDPVLTNDDLPDFSTPTVPEQPPGENASYEEMDAYLRRNHPDMLKKALAQWRSKLKVPEKPGVGGRPALPGFEERIANTKREIEDLKGQIRQVLQSNEPDKDVQARELAIKVKGLETKLQTLKVNADKKNAQRPAAPAPLPAGMLPRKPGEPDVQIAQDNPVVPTSAADPSWNKNFGPIQSLDDPGTQSYRRSKDAAVKIPGEESHEDVIRRLYKQITTPVPNHEPAPSPAEEPAEPQAPATPAAPKFGITASDYGMKRAHKLMQKATGKDTGWTPEEIRAEMEKLAPETSEENNPDQAALNKKIYRALQTLSGDYSPVERGPEASGIENHVFTPNKDEQRRLADMAKNLVTQHGQKTAIEAVKTKLATLNKNPFERNRWEFVLAQLETYGQGDEEKKVATKESIIFDKWLAHINEYADAEDE